MDFYQLNVEDKVYLNHPDSNIINFLKTKRNISVIFFYDDYNNIFDIIHKTDIVPYIKINNKELFNKYLFNHLSLVKDNIIIVNKNNFIKINEYIKYEKTLFLMIKEASKLSCLEKYLYAYNIVKSFKTYKESKNIDDCRDIYKILNNDYIVCVGYINLLSDLLNKLQIENTSYVVDVVGGKHNRLIVNIRDLKYNVDGIYISDPTFDRSFDFDYYNHALITPLDSTYLKRHAYLSISLKELFFLREIDDYYTYLNKYLKYIDNDKNILFYEIINEISHIDINYYNYLKNKYKSVNSNNINLAILDIYKYITRKNNNMVGCSTFKSVINFLYDKFYGYKNVSDEVSKTLILNNKRQDCKYYMNNHQFDLTQY